MSEKKKKIEERTESLTFENVDSKTLWIISGFMFVLSMFALFSENSAMGFLACLIVSIITIPEVYDPVVRSKIKVRNEQMNNGTMKYIKGVGYEFYCPYCKGMRQVVRKRFNWPAFIILSILSLGLGLIIYPLYHMLKTKNRCIQCGAKIASSMNQPLYTKE